MRNRKFQFAMAPILGAMLAILVLFGGLWLPAETVSAEVTHSVATWATDGVNTGSEIQTSLPFYVAAEVYALTNKAEVSATVKIRYNPSGVYPNQSYSLIGPETLNAPNMQFMGAQNGYLVFEGTIPAYAGAPSILAVEFQPQEDSVNDFDIQVEIDGFSLPVDPVRVVIGEGEQIISDLSTSITAPAEVEVGVATQITWTVDLPGDPPFIATLQMGGLVYEMGKHPDRRGAWLGISRVFETPGVITATAVITPGDGVLDPNWLNNTQTVTFTVLAPIEPIEDPINPIFLPLIFSNE